MLDFKVDTVFQDDLLTNITFLERTFQRKLRVVGPFPKALHRVAGAGADRKYKNLNTDPKQLFCLFMSYSFTLCAHIRAEKVKRNR